MINARNILNFDASERVQSAVLVGDYNRAREELAAIERFGVSVEDVLDFFSLPALNTVGDIKLSNDESVLLRTSMIMTDEERQGLSLEQSLLTQFAKGCVTLDRILMSHAATADAVTIQNQRIALLLAWKYVQDLHTKDGNLSVSSEFNVLTATLSPEAQRLRVLLADPATLLPSSRGATHTARPLVTLLRTERHNDEDDKGEPTPNEATSAEKARIREELAAGSQITEIQIIGRLIAAARKASNMELTDFASTGFSTAYLSAVERGQIRSSKGALEKIAQALGVTYGDITMTEEEK